jgi:CubicO group peptidase (beta-lactamase class C family)
MKKQISILLNIFLLLALSACGALHKPSRLPDQNEVKKLLFQLVDVEKRSPGIVVGMISDDPQESWVVGYGRLSATDPRVPDGDTVYEICSITKVFTGFLLVQAMMHGEVQLDDPISMYLPEGVTAPEYEDRAITLLDLAFHTSGLPRFDTTPKDYTMDQLYAYLSGYQLTRAPGSTYEYSNFGSALLAHLLVRVAGEADYEALLVDRITRPLGMDSTRIEVTSEMYSRLAPPHNKYGTPTESWEAPAFIGAGGIRSTANDMLTFLAANMGITETELQPALQQANKPQSLTSEANYIGLGWLLPKYAVGIIKHNGQSLGYNSFLAWNTERKIGVVVLSNAHVNIDDLGLQLITGNESGRQFPRSIEITLITWAILTAGCLVFLIWELWGRQPAPRGARLMWLLTTVFMGPVGLLIYWISTGGSQHSGSPVEPTSPARGALGSAAWAATGNAVGVIGALALVLYLPREFGNNPILQIVAAILLCLCMGWFIFAASRWLSQPAAGHDLYSRRPLFVEVGSTCLVLAGLFSVVYYMIVKWFNLWTPGSSWGLLYPPLWGALCLGAIAGTLVTYPFHLWMLRRDLFRWGTVAISNVPTRELAWYVKVMLVVLSLVIMLGAIFLSMQIAQG